MRAKAPAATFIARVAGFPSGLAGTVGVQIIAADGTVQQARATAGIVEYPAGSGSYAIQLTAPSEAGEYAIFWDDGSVAPATTYDEKLIVSWDADEPTVQPGATAAARVAGFPSGLAGTVGVTLISSGSTVTARSTAGIVESPAGSGSYLATLTAPETAGDYFAFFDEGSVSPATTAFDRITVAQPVTFASVDELAARLGIAFDTDERDRAQTLLQIATGLIQDEAEGQLIVLVENDTITMPGRNDEVIVLPQRPVVSVSSVILDGDVLAEGVNWYLDDAGAIRRLTMPTVLGAMDAIFDAPLGQFIGFGYPYQTLQITYTHGYATIPNLYKAICLEAVVRVWVNPGSVARATIGDTSTVYDNNRFSPTGLMLTDDERRAIRKQIGKRARGLWIG